MGLSGDAAEALPALMEEHGGRLFGLGVRICGNRDEAEDMVQEVFLQAFKHWSDLRDRERPLPWLYRIATHVCQRMHRPRAGQPREMASLESLLPFAAEEMVDVALLGEDAVEVFFKEEELAEMEACLVALPEDFRVPLVLKDIVGMRLGEVGEVLGIPEATVKTRVHRARLKLRQIVEKHLPRTAASAPVYSQQVCLDLLKAKQEALDRDVPFPADDVLCDRCQAVFASLDLTKGLCQRLGRDELPRDVRQEILARLGLGDKE